MSKKKNGATFEESVSRLEEISRLLDSEDIDLDEAISLYEEGIELSKVCFARLKDAELKITTLRKSLENNTLEESDLEEYL